MKSGWGILLLLFYGIFYMAWYLFLGILWAIYGSILLAVLPIKFIKKKVDSGQWEKGKTIKICSISIAAFILLVIVGSIFSKNDESEIYVPESEIHTIPTSEPAETAVAIEYAKDELVNRFINEYNAIAKYQMQDISKGNIRIKYHCKVNGCWIEMLNATESDAEVFSIEINSGNSDGAEEKAFAVFTDMAKVLDPDLTDEKIKEAFVERQNGGTMNFSDKFNVNFFKSTEESWGKTDYRIYIQSKYYN